MHSLEQKDSECNDLFDRLQASEKQYEGLTEKYRALNNAYEKNKISGQVLKVSWIQQSNELHLFKERRQNNWRPAEQIGKDWRNQRDTFGRIQKGN